MKIACALAILTYTAVQAVAIAEPEVSRHHGWSCGVPGAPCFKAKRAAFAVAEALADVDPVRSTFSTCSVPGELCEKARRSLEAIGAATETTIDGILARDQDHAAVAHRKKLFHAGFPGVSHSMKREAAPRHHWWSCSTPGAPCAKTKRGLSLIKEESPDFHKDECFAEGGECHTVLKAREAFDQAVKREAEPRRYWSCGAPGVPCARSVLEAAEAKESGDPAALKAEEECYGPDGDCTAAEKYFEHLDATITKAIEDVLKNN